MSGATPESRAAVMILVEASWKDQTGALQAVPAYVADKSAGGACIRTKTPIGVGSKLTIQGRWEQITGIARYCRRVGREYLVGIQRDPTKDSAQLESEPSSDLPLPIHTLPTAALPTPKIQGQPERRESKHTEVSRVEPKVESVSMAEIASFAAAMTPQENCETGCDRPGIMPPPISYVLRRTELQTIPPAKTKEAGNERKHMQSKWLDRAPWRKQPDGVHGNGNSNGNSGNENTRIPRDLAGEDITSFQVGMLSMEDIYRAAGIVNPRR